jgi:hypothetical protein
MLNALIFSVRKNIPERGAGAHRIATHLRNQGMDVEVIDFATQWSLQELQELVKSRVDNQTVFFGFSTFFSYWTHTIDQFTKWLKESYPTIPIILGGQSVLMTPATTVDYWVDSFGEYAISELVKSLTGNSTDNIIFEEYTSKKVIRALNNYPAYPLPSYMNKLERRDFLQPYEFLTTELSRGCKFKCSFCTFPILGIKEDTSRPAEDFQEELIYNYNEFGIVNYHIADETANDRIEKIIKYADVVDTLNFKPWFNGFLRADLLAKQKPYWDHYKKMRFGGHFYGIETFNKEAGKVVKKGADPDYLKTNLLDFKNQMGSLDLYRGTMSLICGLPKESEYSWNATVNWLNENWTSESVVVYYLEVPNIENNQTTHSLFSKNPSKYGLRTKNTIPIIPEVNFHQGDQIQWEHDLMSQPRAMELVQYFKKTHQSNFMPAGFRLNFLSAQYKTSDIHKILKYQTINETHGEYNTFIENYKTKKLNWKKI